MLHRHQHKNEELAVISSRSHELAFALNENCDPTVRSDMIQAGMARGVFSWVHFKFSGRQPHVFGQPPTTGTPPEKISPPNHHIFAKIPPKTTGTNQILYIKM